MSSTAFTLAPVKASEAYLFFKTVNYSVRWLQIDFPALPKRIQKIGALSSESSLALGALTFYGDAEKVGKNVVSFASRPSLLGASKIVRNTSGLLISLSDGIELLKSREIIQVSETTSSLLGTISGLVISFLSSYYLTKNVIKVFSAKTWSAATGDLFQLGKNLSYLALGVTAVANSVLALGIAPWILLAMATSALIFSLMSYFHDKIPAQRT